MTETKCFRDAFRDQLYELSGQPNITLQNNAIIKLNYKNHNHDPELTENVQTVLTRLKRRVLANADHTIGNIYEEKVEKSS